MESKTFIKHKTFRFTKINPVTLTEEFSLCCANICILYRPGCEYILSQVSHTQRVFDGIF